MFQTTWSIRHQFWYVIENGMAAAVCLIQQKTRNASVGHTEVVVCFINEFLSQCIKDKLLTHHFDMKKRCREI